MIADRAHQLDSAVVREAQIREALPGPRVQREEDGGVQPIRDGLQAGHDPTQAAEVRRVLLAVDGGDDVPTGEELATLEDLVDIRHRCLAAELVHDRVAGHVDAAGVDPLGDEDRGTRFRWCEEDVRQVVDQGAIDLLRHRPVVRAQPGLYMADSDVSLVRRECDPERGVGITLDEDGIDLLGGQDRHHPVHDPGQLARRMSRPDVQVVIRLGQLQLVEERTIELEAVVLAGMDQGER